MLFRGHCCLSLSTDNFPGHMTYPVASLTLEIIRSCVMHSAFLTQRKASNIPIVFSWGGSIRPKGFLSFILLLAVIIVAVVMVVLIVVDAIIWVVVAISGVSSIIKLSFVIIDSVHRIVLCYLIYQPLSYGNGFLQSLRLRGGNISFNTSGSSSRSGVPIGIVLAIVATCASRAVVTLSATSFLMAA
ncbi:hypothetical protein Tco_1313147 [Tanacetum coccineum]